jgi:hypothetical protein
MFMNIKFYFEGFIIFKFLDKYIFVSLKKLNYYLKLFNLSVKSRGSISELLLVIVPLFSVYWVNDFLQAHQRLAKLL